MGQLAKRADGACVHLRSDGCAVYESRPQVCRDFMEQGCTIYEPDPEKESGRVRLRVLLD